MPRAGTRRIPPSRVINVDLSSCRAVAEIVKIGVDHFEKRVIAADECTQADVSRSQVDHNNLSEHSQKERGRLPRGHVAACLWVPGISWMAGGPPE